MGSLETGKAGELRVASELLLRGHRVSMSLIDSGTDLILDDGTKIQVKANHKCFTGSVKNGRYVFAFRHWKRMQGKHEQIYNDIPEFLNYVILWCIDEDTFYIIPASLLRRKKIRVITVSVSSLKKHTSWLNEYKDNWDVLLKKQRQVMPNGVVSSTEYDTGRTGG